MRIAVDARELEARPTGVGRVLSGILRAWPTDDELFLVARRSLETEEEIPGTPVRKPGPTRMPGVGWEQLVLPGVLRDVGAEALLAPAYGMPALSPCPAVVGMHDCAFRAVPETFGWRERWRRRLVARVAARRAAALFAGSEFAADEIRRWLGVGSDRVEVVPYGVDRRFRPPAAERVEEIRRRHEIDGPLVLFVGSALGRRDLPGLDRVVTDLARTRPGLQLGLVGTGPDEPLRLRTGRWLGYVADADLPALYGAATVVAYPSRYEGFGLPVLEALACDTPVVATRTTALAEVFEERARLVPPGDDRAWHRALAELLDDAAARRRLVAISGPWARDRNWSVAATRVRRLLARAAGGAS